MIKRSYLSQFLLECEMIQTKVVEEIKTNLLCSVIFFRKWYRLGDNVEKYSTAGQATDGNLIQLMCIACCILKATNTHTQNM